MNQWLPTYHHDLKAIKFHAVNPGKGQNNPRYRNEPTIIAFLGKTTLELSGNGKRLRVDYHGSSAEPERPHLEKAVTWFIRVTARCKDSDGRNFQDLLADCKVRQETSLNAMAFVAYACSDISGQESQQYCFHGWATNLFLSIPNECVAVLPSGRHLLGC